MRGRLKNLTHEALQRVAAWPTRFAPTAAELATPEPPPRPRTHRELAAAAELTEAVWAGDTLVSVCLSGRAYLSLAASVEPPLTDVRLVAITPFLAELAAAPHARALVALRLPGCRIGPAGLAVLRGATHGWPNLVTLDLRGNGVET